MRVSREQAAANRERVVKLAAELYRERGFAGIGVADIMKSAGLTHGGFSGQFGSKEGLMAAACSEALAQSAAYWDALTAADPQRGLAELISHYLSPAHRDAAGQGCAIAALGPELARAAPAVRSAATSGIQAMLDKLAQALPAGTDPALAMQLYASLIGTLVLARAVDAPELSQALLEQNRAALLAQIAALTPDPQA
ncbi:TetR/AcrR family transcriptional regulator [Chitinimonas taiwanensis]|uniref:TetR/AcrR family transcriptional regulator n=1 Tax=Chitinimonas taiwanensis TaxID=240412 RepID=UPI0035AF9B7C